MNNESTTRKRKEMGRYRAFNGIVTFVGMLIGLWFLYVGITTALGINEIAPFALSFGNPVGGAIVFSLIGLIFTASGACSLWWLIMRPPEDKELVDVAADAHADIAGVYRLNARIGIALIALGVVSAMAAAAGLLDSEGFAQTFIRPDLVPLGFGFVAVILLSIGAVYLLYRPTKEEHIANLDERNRTITGNAALVALQFLMIALACAFFGLTLLGYMNVVSMFTICSIMIAGSLVWLGATAYFKKKM